MFDIIRQQENADENPNKLSWYTCQKKLKYRIVTALNAGEDGEKPQSLIYCWWEHRTVVTLGMSLEFLTE